MTSYEEADPYRLDASMFIDIRQIECSCVGVLGERQTPQNALFKEFNAPPLHT